METVHILPEQNTVSECRSPPETSPSKQRISLTDQVSHLSN